MEDQLQSECVKLSASTAPPTDDQVVVAQLADMKDQTAYMKQFRTALGSALDEVKILRSELALEKSKAFESLRGQHPAPMVKSRSTDYKSGLKLSGCQKEANEDLCLVIGESEKTLMQIKDAVSKRQDLIRDLRKRLQISSSVLVKREHKLEEKINQENNMKIHINEMVQERARLQEVIHTLDGELQNEKSRSMIKDKEIKNLLKQMSEMEENQSQLYRRINSGDREIYEMKNQMQNSSSCYKCSWMREYIRRLEYKLEKYRYSSVDGRYHQYPGLYGEEAESSSHLRNYHHRANTSHSSPNNSYVHQRPTSNKINRNEAYRRQLGTNRERLQQFRSASLALSPITEEETDTSKDKLSNDSHESAPNESLKEIMTDHKQFQMIVNESSSINPLLLEEKQSYKVDQSREFLIKPKDEVPSDPCAYFTVRSGDTPQIKTDDKSPRTSPAYLHISQTQNNCLYSIQVAESQKSIPDRKATYSAPTPLDYNSEHARTSKSLQLPKTPHRDEAAPTVALNKPFFHIRSFPLLNPPTPNGSVPSTDASTDRGSTGCSSDSAVSCKRLNKKFVKTRRIKRKAQKFIFFRDHKIDVTRFSMLDFRQIMWSMCTDGKTAEEFLDFLASEAKRLHNDPDWTGKHSLGSPEEWLSLKGSY